MSEQTEQPLFKGRQEQTQNWADSMPDQDPNTSPTPKDINPKDANGQPKFYAEPKPRPKYKEEKAARKAKASGHASSSSNSNYSAPRYSSHDDVMMILEDKMKNSKIELSRIEEKIISEYLVYVQNRKDNNRDKDQRDNKSKGDQRDNRDQRDRPKSTCNVGKQCIVWECIFEHPEDRQPECNCNDNECKKLHRNQALCRKTKSRDHPADCDMAHSMEDLNI